MFGTPTWLDAVLGVVLVLAFLRGVGRGASVVVGSLLGWIAGAVSAGWVLPSVGARFGDPLWRGVALLMTAVVLVLVGQAAGAWLGARIRARLRLTALRRMDGLLGGVASLAAGMLVVWLAAGAVAAYGPAAAARETERSRVVTALEEGMPDAVREWTGRAGQRVADMAEQVDPRLARRPQPARGIAL